MAVIFYGGYRILFIQKSAEFIIIAPYSTLIETTLQRKLLYNVQATMIPFSPELNFVCNAFISREHLLSRKALGQYIMGAV